MTNILDRMADTLRTGAEARGWVDLADLLQSGFSHEDIQRHGPQAALMVWSPEEQTRALARHLDDPSLLSLLTRAAVEAHRVVARAPREAIRNAPAALLLVAGLAWPVAMIARHTGWM
ncbi:MAG: hypothetical protein CMN87_12260 [Stappia sp.]|uniref:hypothetical protein n=1 Tax=Stappia sp. TaxID=1870903 RepID=UPI000C66699F|nr:hypothetical protein [Stappia sp.]MAB00136.1 hypothetical protein [Stappia sp.]MBM20775.1 hypothetical protein [Stappia sp.]